jgi:hypothetical protein
MNAGIIARKSTLQAMPLRVMLCLAGLVGLAAAQYARAQEPVVDPPGRVARLSLMDGDVSVAPAGTEEWADGVLNRPITSGDRLAVGADGRAELQIGTASVHLDRSTSFEFIELDDDVMQMSLTEGVANVRVRTLGDREQIQLETPNATVHFNHPGDYTVEVDPQTDRTIVRTRNGEAEVTGASKSFRVRADEEGTFTGLDGLTADIGRIPPRTPFESWANDRDRRGDNSEAARYVSREVVGYEDLDGHGEWINEPSYGYVWRPTYVVADWAPYRYGRWGWVAPWGWTWIDAAPWGFAPFHYGRWAFVSHHWCWVPGPRYIRPYYAPALVGWIGGPSVSVSLSFGSVGWFPLGPHEVYQPWYRHTPRYVRHVNVSNTIIVNNVTNIYGGRGQRPGYVNSAMARAVTAVNRDQFVGGRPVGTQRVHVDEGQLRQWRSNVRPSSIAPDRESILAGQPRREAPPRASFAQDNPKRASGGDFRAARVAAEEIRRAQSSARNIAPEKRVALREPGRNSQFEDRSVERSQNANREPERVQSMRGESERPARDHMERPPVQALQGSPSESQSNRSGSNEMIRRARESMDQRDVFRQDNSRPERQAPVERRESAAPRESVHRQSAPRDSAPVMRSQPRIEQSQPRVERSYSPPREVHSSPPPREVRSSPPPDNSSRQNSNQGSSRHSGGNDDGGSNRDRPNRRPD